MIHFIKMKRNEWRIKAVVYGAIAAFLDNQKGISELMQKMYIAFKDLSEDELREELIRKVAEIVHAKQADVIRPCFTTDKQKRTVINWLTRMKRLYLA